MPIERLYPRRGEGLQSYVGNLNFDTRYSGRATPSFDNFEIVNSTDVLHYFVRCVETIAPLGTSTGGQPRQYAGANKSMFRLDNGTRTTDTTFNDVVQGMVIGRIGGYTGGTASAVTSTTLTDDDADWPTNHWAGHTVTMDGQTSTISSNTATVLTVAAWTTTPTAGAYTIEGIDTTYLIVGFGSSTDPRIAYRNCETDTSPSWTVGTDDAYAQFWLIEKAGADLYAVTDAGVAILGEYRISKCPSGNDPRLATSWGNGLVIGTPEWAITGLAAIGDSVVVGKPDGLYYYNDQTKRFENVLAHLVDSPHAVNGKGMRSVTNGVLYPTHDGKLYFFDGVAVQEVTPWKDLSLPRDVGTSRITAIADNGDTVAVVTECWQNTTQGLGMKVITRIAGTYADVTTDVNDGVLTTGANVGTWGADADDAIYIGADVPIEAVVFRVTRNVNAVEQSFGNVEYSNGSAALGAPFDTAFTSFGSVVDGSILSLPNISLVNTGFPPSASNAVVTWTNINAFDLMQENEISFGGSVGTLTKYWVRLKRTSAAGFTASTTIDEVEIVPCRPGLPNSGPLTTSTNFTRRDHAGGMTHVYLGKREQTVGFTWHDVYAINTLGGVWAIGWHSGRSYYNADGVRNMGQTLVLWGRYKQFQISEGPTRDPGRTIAPALANFSSVCAGPLLNLAPGGTYLGNPLRRKRLIRFMYDCDFIQPTDQVSVFFQWDEGRDVAYGGSVRGGPAAINVEGSGGDGRKLQAWLTINGAYQPVAAQQIKGVWVEFEEVGQDFDFVQDPVTDGSVVERT